MCKPKIIARRRRCPRVLLAGPVNQAADKMPIPVQVREGTGQSTGCGAARYRAPRDKSTDLPFKNDVRRFLRCYASGTPLYYMRWCFGAVAGADHGLWM